MDEALTRAGAEIAGFVSRPVYGLSDTELGETAAVVHAIGSRCAAILATLAQEAHGRDLPHRQGATSTVAWLRDLLRISPAEARQLVTLGQVLDERPVLADAVTDGAVNTAQAVAIGRVLADVPDQEPGLVDKVETVLIGHAGQFEPTILRRFGERVIAHLNPDLADQRLRDRLEREQRHAQQRRGFTLSPDGLGGIRLTGSPRRRRRGDHRRRHHTPDHDPYATRPAPTYAPRPPAAPTPWSTSASSRYAPENCPPPADRPPRSSSPSTRRPATRGSASASWTPAHLLTPEATRRLACDAGILPAILDGASVPIDVGRARRPFTGATRTAILLRDGGCAFPGCDRPPRWTDIHHIVFWSDGGATDRDNGVALCRHHHRLIHTTDWTIRIGPDRKPDFIPPTHIDPTQQPRRNPYHQRN